MKKTLDLIFSCLNYYFRAQSKYKIHSPFVYDFVDNVMQSKETPAAYQKIENIRKDLLKRNERIIFKDLGAGSNKPIVNENKVKISSLARNSSISRRFGLLLYRFVDHYKQKNILELGTSFGIGSMYLASAGQEANITTIEGDTTICDIAKSNFKKLGFSNIKSICGDINDVLDNVIDEYKTLDLVYFDGNHQYGPSLRYFNKCLAKAGNESVFILDDIRWSKEMYKAWKEIKSHPRVTVSIDLFRMGLVFFRKESAKQDFLIRF